MTEFIPLMFNRFYVSFRRPRLVFKLSNENVGPLSHLLLAGMCNDPVIPDLALANRRSARA